MTDSLTVVVASCAAAAGALLVKLAPILGDYWKSRSNLLYRRQAMVTALESGSAATVERLLMLTIGRQDNEIARLTKEHLLCHEELQKLRERIAQLEKRTNAKT